MSDYLVLRFTDIPTEPVEWIVVDQFGAPQGSIENGDLRAAALAAQDKRVIALVPGTNVLRTFVDIPIRSRAKLLQAVPFAVEEQLAGNIEELHFAVGKRDANDRVPVAVVECLKMEAWLEQISAVGLDLIGVYTDGDALGEMPNTSILLVEAERVTLRDATGHVAATDSDSIDALLEMWLNQQKQADNDELPPPINMLVYVTPDCSEALQPSLDHLRSKVETLEVMTLTDGALPRMAAQSIAEPGTNLLQGPYAPRSTFGTYWPAWRIAASLLVGLSITLLGAKILEITSLNSQVARLDQAIEQGIRYTFPEVREVRDARSLFDSKLRSLGNMSPTVGSTGFLDTLNHVAAAVADNGGKGAKIESINYRSGIMELRVAAPNVEALDSIRESISQDAALQAEIQSANPDGESVQGRLQIKRTGA